MVAKSQELGMVVALAFGAGFISVRGDQLASGLKALNARAFAEAGSIDTGGYALMAWMGRLISETATTVAPLIATVVIGALLASIAQTGVIFAPAALKADVPGSIRSRESSACSRCNCSSTPAKRSSRWRCM